jgi:transcriptional regulator with XRE-family HTH domain
MADGTYRTPLQRIIVEEGRRQSWLAERVGISQSRMSLIVNGLHVDDDNLRTAIAEALRRPVDEIFPPEVPA